jgi:hypothetical protein
MQRETAMTSPNRPAPESAATQFAPATAARVSEDNHSRMRDASQVSVPPARGGDDRVVSSLR